MALKDSFEKTDGVSGEKQVLLASVLWLCEAHVDTINSPINVPFALEPNSDDKSRGG
jgi:hypothetical protein